MIQAKPIHLWYNNIFSCIDFYSTINLTGFLFNLQVGLIYVFNLIVGTGALTLPAAFAGAGWVISLCFILALAVIR